MLTIKVVLLGDTFSGKGSLTNRFVRQTFVSHYSIPTAGVEFNIKQLLFGLDKQCKLQMWDVGALGDARTHFAFSGAYMRGAAAIMVVYNLADRSSFDRAKEYLAFMKSEGIKNRVSGSHAMLVANHLDNEENRKVSSKEGEALAKEYGADFFEVSAKTGLNVEKAFLKLAEGALVADIERVLGTKIDIKSEDINMRVSPLLSSSEQIKDTEKRSEKMEYFLLKSGMNPSLKNSVKSTSDIQNVRRIIKVVLLGFRSGIGKTALVDRFTTGEYREPSYGDGLSFSTGYIPSGQDNSYKLQIWHAPAQDHFKTLIEALFRGAMGCMVAYDLSDRSSFEGLKECMALIKRHGLDPASGGYVTLVATKLDYVEENEKNRKVSREEGEALAKEWGADFFEVSAKTGVNVDEAFIKLGQGALIADSQRKLTDFQERLGVKFSVESGSIDFDSVFERFPEVTKNEKKASDKPTFFSRMKTFFTKSDMKGAEKKIDSIVASDGKIEGSGQPESVPVVLQAVDTAPPPLESKVQDEKSVVVDSVPVISPGKMEETGYFTDEHSGEEKAVTLTPEKVKKMHKLLDQDAGLMGSSLDREQAKLEKEALIESFGDTTHQFYHAISTKIANFFVGAQSASSNFVRVSAGNAQYVASGVNAGLKAAAVAGSFFIPGGPIATFLLQHNLNQPIDRITSGIEMIGEIRQQNFAKKVAFLFTINELRKFTDSVAMRLAESYREPLEKLSAERQAVTFGEKVKEFGKTMEKAFLKGNKYSEAEKLAEYVVAWMLESIEELDKNSPHCQSREALENYLVESILRTPTKTDGVLGAMGRMKEKIFFQFGFECVKTRDGEYWTYHSFFTKPGMKTWEEEYYHGNGTEPEKYGYCLVKKEDALAKALKLEKTENKETTTKAPQTPQRTPRQTLSRRVSSQKLFSPAGKTSTLETEKAPESVSSDTALIIKLQLAVAALEERDKEREERDKEKESRIAELEFKSKQLREEKHPEASKASRGKEELMEMPATNGEYAQVFVQAAENDDSLKSYDTNDLVEEVALLRKEKILSDKMLQELREELRKNKWNKFAQETIKKSVLDFAKSIRVEQRKLDPTYKDDLNKYLTSMLLRSNLNVESVDLIKLENRLSDQLKPFFYYKRSGFLFMGHASILMTIPEGTLFKNDDLRSVIDTVLKEFEGIENQDGRRSTFSA